MNEQEFTRSVIRGADALLEMMNQNPAKYMKTARLSRPPYRLDLAPGLYRLYLDDYVRDGAEVFDGEQRIPDIEIRKLCMKKGDTEKETAFLSAPLGNRFIHRHRGFVQKTKLKHCHSNKEMEFRVVCLGSKIV